MRLSDWNLNVGWWTDLRRSLESGKGSVRFNITLKECRVIVNKLRRCVVVVCGLVFVFVFST